MTNMHSNNIVATIERISDTPGIVKHSSHTDADAAMADAKAFDTKYGPEHHTEFMVIYVDMTNVALVERLQSAFGENYGICDIKMLRK